MLYKSFYASMRNILINIFQIYPREMFIIFFIDKKGGLIVYVSGCKIST